MEATELVFISLGSNQGDSLRIVREAMDRLQAWSTRPVLRSSFWLTSPCQCPAGSPPFVNAAAGLASEAGATPERLLRDLQSLEILFGRAPKKVANEPRRLDLDLIAFGQQTRNSAFLQLPHPRAHQRRFVLQPLSEIAPDFVMPGQGQTVLELLAALETDEDVRRIESCSSPMESA